MLMSVDKFCKFKIVPEVGAPINYFSVNVALDQPVLQVSTVTFVYALLNIEITFAGKAIGAGAATVGSRTVAALLK